MPLPMKNAPISPLNQVAEIADQKAHKRKTLWFGLVIICLVALSAVFWLFLNLNSKEAEFETNLKDRMEFQASGRAYVVSTWLSELAGQGDRVIESDLFRLYATEVNLIEGDVSLLVTGIAPAGADISDLAAQLPMMQNLLEEFTRYSGFLRSRIVSRSGQTYISTDKAPLPLSRQQQALINNALTAPRPYYSPVRHTESGLVMDILLPIFPPEAGNNNKLPVAVLMLTKAVSDKINELLSISPLAEKGERARLVQQSGDTFQEVVPWLPGELDAISQPLQLNGQSMLDFSARQEIRGSETTYSLAVPIPGLDWWIVQESDYSISRRDLRTYNRTTSSIAGLLILVFSVSFGAVWWRIVSKENKRIAESLGDLAHCIEEQRAMLESVNNTIADYIGLKDLRGIYIYANPAFANALGRQPDEVVGLDDTALFGFDTAKRLERSDQHVLNTGHPMTLSEHVYLQSRLHYLQISKVPLKDNSGQNAGVVSVCRDVTDIVEVQKRQEKAVKQTIQALVGTVELTDPYLAGHSQFLGGFAVAIAKALNASEEQLATIETAANLSQIGKLFVDKKVLLKPDMLSEDEKKEIESHAEHAARILKEIDFDLPISEAVYQMNENFDGSGYPQGLKGEEIEFPARVLSISNRFCAMVCPRSYRPAYSLEESLSILEQTSHQHDPEVMDTLKAVVHSRKGEQLLANNVKH